MVRTRMRLSTRMILFVTVLVAAIVGLMGAVFASLLSSSIEEQIGKRALSVAKVVAGLPEIRQAFTRENPSLSIQPIAERIRLQTEAEFVVVGNREGIRYAHPVPDRIGKEMVGGDNEQALLHGQSYVSKAVGTLGPSLRGKVPITDDAGRVIGIVSVGFLLEDIHAAVDRYRIKLMWMALAAAVLGIAGAVVLSRSFKRAIFNLEPEEIAALFVERSAVLESVREGIVAIDRHGRISMVNQAAAALLEFPGERDLIGRPVQEVIPHSAMLEVLRTGEQQLDRQASIAGREIVVNRIPIKVDGEVIGVVSSFRDQSELGRLAEELSQAKRYAEALRAQTHEFHNLLYTISGLLQLGSVQEAIDLISQETSSQQELTVFLAKAVPDPLIGALLLGLTSRARELKIEFEIDRDSRLCELPLHLNRQQLVSVLGNVIQNAFEAVSDGKSGEKRVICFLSDNGKEIFAEVEDSGSGVREDMRDLIFRYGFSTKQGEHRGIGLANVKQILDDLGGYILVGESELGGALFTICIPKERRERE